MDEQGSAARCRAGGQSSTLPTTVLGLHDHPRQAAG
jgi:hypothetical protein